METEKSHFWENRAVSRPFLGKSAGQRGFVDNVTIHSPI